MHKTAPFSSSVSTHPLVLISFMLPFHQKKYNRILEFLKNGYAKGPLLRERPRACQRTGRAPKSRATAKWSTILQLRDFFDGLKGRS